MYIATRYPCEVCIFRGSLCGQHIWQQTVGCVQLETDHHKTPQTVAPAKICCTPSLTQNFGTKFYVHHVYFQVTQHQREGKEGVFFAFIILSLGFGFYKFLCANKGFWLKRQASNFESFVKNNFLFHTRPFPKIFTLLILNV